MADPLPTIHLIRHGQTAWSVAGKHTGRSDIPLTPLGEQNAARLGHRLRNLAFTQVWTSPSSRARQTCTLAGFGAVARVDDDLAEWDYGQYEGLRTAEILQSRPDWQIFRDGCPGGESITDISARADRVVARLRSADANILVFSSAHFLRVLGARWLGFDAASGRLLALQTASVSILGYEHNRDEPALQLWNDVSATLPTR